MPWTKKKRAFSLHIRTRTQQSRGRFIQKQEEKKSTKQKEIRRKNNKYIYLILLNKYKIYTHMSHLANLNNNNKTN